MQRSLIVALLASLACVSALDLSPITRVVQLIQNLGKQIEKDHKAEEEMFETYICWGKGVVDTKTAANSAASSRIDMLTAYLADIAAGRVEFTSERQDLEKEIAELTGDLETAKAMRDQENKDFKVAEDEMKKAVAALTSAVDVLGKATKNHTASMVSVKTSVNQGFAEREAEGVSLNQAVELGKKFLTKGDAFFLQRLLTGEVPNHDWKKLNRKATFKMSYKARSGKIQAVLAKLKSTFARNLKDAQDKEADAVATHKKLKDTKDGQLKKAQDSLTKMEKENGAKGMSKTDAENEVKNLKADVVADTKFIADTTASMATKTTEWKARSVLRTKEAAAMSQAIGILSSDDARDNFKKSGASQGFLFLQTTQRSVALAKVSQQIQDVARVTNDQRLLSIVRSATAGNFDAVIAAVDKMVTTLKANEKADLAHKQDCEKTRMGDVRDAIEAGREVDDYTDSITSLVAEIKDLNHELDETKAQLQAAKDEIAAALKIRNAEKAEHAISDADDDEASKTVQNAVDVLTKFYKDNNLSLVQKDGAEPPPPPPATWDGAYGGKTGESAGIIGILTLCKEDIDKDRKSAQDDEDVAAAAYTKLEKENAAEQKAYGESIGDLNGRIGTKGASLSADKKSRDTKHGEMKATMTKIENANPDCNYIEVNYPVRVKNRQLEIDGLLKAKAILGGGSFAKPADPNRDVKPGDAFLAIHRH